MLRFLKLFWVITCIVFMVVLFYVYAYLPDAIHLVDEVMLTRTDFFYIMIGIFGITSILLYVIRRFIELHPSFENDTNTFQEDMINWLISFSGVVNVVLILGMIIVAMDYNPDGMRHSIPSFFVYFGPVLVGIWAVLLILVVVRKIKGRA